MTYVAFNIFTLSDGSRMGTHPSRIGIHLGKLPHNCLEKHSQNVDDSCKVDKFLKKYLVVLIVYTLSHKTAVI